MRAGDPMRGPAASAADNRDKMAAPIFQALLRNLPLIIQAGAGLYKLWVGVQGTKEENNKVIQAMTLLRSHQDDIDRLLEDPEQQRVLMEGYSILLRRIQERQSEQRNYGEPGRHQPIRNFEDGEINRHRENGNTGKEDYREQNPYRGEDYRCNNRERNCYRGGQEEGRQQAENGKKTTDADNVCRDRDKWLSKVKDHLLCDVCTEQYDNDHHRPLLLPTCGHTFCRNCLRSISCRQHLRCPVCRCDPFMDVSSLPTNMEVLSLLTEENEANGEDCEDVRGARCAPSAPCQDSYEENSCSYDIHGTAMMSFEEQLQYALMLSSELQGANNINPYSFLDEINNDDDELQMALAMSLDEHQEAQEANRHTLAERTEEQRQQMGNPIVGSRRDREEWWLLEREREEVREERERLDKEKEEWKRKMERENNQERARQNIRELTMCLDDSANDCCGEDEYCKENECCSEDEDCTDDKCGCEYQNCIEKECCLEEEAAEDLGNTVVGASYVDSASSMTDKANLLAIVNEEENRERRMRREKRRRMKFQEDLELARALSLSLQVNTPSQE
ncbi:hypothetical protein Pmani_011382 [Petrolisthes manimaculis]|uniref:RING-type domain-containing protein n=1 Tax=Petrolisthes manimaculis TaxID=1843537 RepID=A0AAE1UB66_9EUCA|nr:hypothetical protein Pmani_011382 [Petrolisthes manimaculis]